MSFIPFTRHRRRSRAIITKRGAVLLGKNFTVDAHEGRALRVVTHAHADHTLGLGERFRRCEKVVMTPATSKLIEAIYGPKLDPKNLNSSTLEKASVGGTKGWSCLKPGTSPARLKCWSRPRRVTGSSAPGTSSSPRHRL